MDVRRTGRDSVDRAGGPLDQVWLLSPAGRVLGSSVGAGAPLGVDGPAPTGRRFSELLHHADVDEFDRAWQRAVGAGHAAERVVRGDAGLLRMRVEPPASQDGPVIVVVRDTNGVGHAPQQARLLRRVTEAANESMATPDLFDRVVGDITATMGWTRGRVVLAGEEPADGDGPAALGGDGSSLRPDVRHAAVPFSAPREVDTPSGAGVVAVPVLTDGQVAAVLEFATPEVVDVDGQLGLLLANLGRQLGLVVEREQARAALAAGTAELERSNEELERFAYVASHDLQEPLRKIVGFSELLEQRYEDRFDQDGQEYLGYVVDGARRMQRLIKDLLAYSRAGRAMPAPVRVDLDAVTRQVLDVLQLSIDEAGAHVVVGDLPAVWGDAGQLAEVLTNLVGNAVKYGPPGGATVSIRAQEHGDSDACEVTVADDGIGIDPAYQEQVFEVFRRLHGPAEYPGTGIGLAIARRFVQANGGRIWVTPNEPQGSVFHFTIGLAPQEAS